MVKERVGGRPLDELKAAIRASGLRVTASRVAVLALLRSTESSLSYREILARLGPDAFGDDRTIYKNLADLVRAGLLAYTDGVGARRFRATRADG